VHAVHRSLVPRAVCEKRRRSRGEVRGGGHPAYLKLRCGERPQDLRRCGHRWDGNVLAWLRPRSTPVAQLLVARVPDLTDAQPSPHWTVPHLERHHVHAVKQLLRLLRVEAHHQPAASARGYGHVAVDEEGQPTKHPLLRDVEIVDHDVVVCGQHGCCLACTDVDQPRPSALRPGERRPGPRPAAATE
jgi:hypothetical protein